MTDDEFSRTARLYEFMPADILEEKIIFQLVSWLVILSTVFFGLVIFALAFLHSRNFCTNRTTSERFSRKKPPTRKGSRSTSVGSEGSLNAESLDSTGSSLASGQADPKHAEDIIREYGEVPDYSDESCATMKNIHYMAFRRAPPDQKKLYAELIKDKEHLLHTYNPQQAAAGKEDGSPRAQDGDKNIDFGGSGGTNQTYGADEEIVEELDGGGSAPRGNAGAHTV